MARTSIWQHKFDRDAEFVVVRPIRVNGVDLRPGSKFENSSVSTRTLRLLYESRKIGMGRTATAQADIKALRAAYVERFGKRPFGAWKEDELRKRLNVA